ncbi:Rhomboid-like protein [Fragilaria crotonensis]|nr:Rhomboid-like protein [Fragilaria crotonensis]
MENDKYMTTLTSNLSDQVDTISPPASVRHAAEMQNQQYEPPKEQMPRDQDRRTRGSDPIDMLVSKVDRQGDDKYRTPILQETIDDGSELSQSQSDGFQTDSYYSTRDMTMSMSSDIEAYARARAQQISDLYQMLEEGDYHRTKQSFAYLSIVLSALQLLILALQLSLCGVAPLDVNPFVGSYPDTLSEWGGKNPTLLKNGEWWRVITPAFLNVGVLQLLVNAAVQLETCAYFEREWGSTRYLWIYVISVVGSQIVSCSANPDTVGVGSSAAIMGLFGAKLAEVVTQVCFEFTRGEAESIRLEQLSSVLCSLSVVMGLSFFTYIDWSAHMGGMGTGFLVGVICFARPIRNRLSRTLWRLLGIILLFSGLPLAFYIFVELVEPDPELANTCEYFRNLYAEGYDCSCFVF